MSILDFFKRKKEREKAEKQPSSRGSSSVALREKEKDSESRDSKTEEITAAASVKAGTVVFSPHITEKSVNLSEKNVYTFKVSPMSNKREIKHAIEELYNVKVDRVNVFNILGKTISVRRIMGRKPNYKKAVVKLAAGHKIEFI